MSLTPADHPLAEQLTRHVAGDVRFDHATRLIYSTDASNYQVMPLGVVLPKSTEDVIATVLLCAEHGVSIVPRGGGSSLCGSSIGPGVVIDFTRYMDALVGIDPAAHTACVQPGLVLGQLNKHLAPERLVFGPDPASAERAAIGGVIGNNATGAHSILYGMTADNVSALRVVLADGTLLEFGVDDTVLKAAKNEKARAGAPGEASETSGRARQLSELTLQLAQRNEPAIRRDFPQVWRRASGYNLDFISEMIGYDPARPQATLTPANARRQGPNLDNHLRQISRFNLAPLFAGAEGTLGIIVEADLHLADKPKHTVLVIAAFDDLLTSMRAVPALLGTNPSAVELIGGMFIKLAKDLPECKQRMGWVDLSGGVPEGLLVIEYAGDSEADVQGGVARLERVAASEHLPCTLKAMYDSVSQADVWHVRKQGLTVLTSIRSTHKPISVVEDVAVPVERLCEYVERLRAIFRANGTDGAFYAHASAGVLHVRPLVNLKTPDGVRVMQDIGRQALALCRELGGAMSGEHGDGYERTHQNEALFGPAVYRAFCDLKDAFDPQGLLNPGKKVRGPSDTDMEAHMRLGPAYATQPQHTTFHFTLDGSFAGTVEQCNGSGVCRKLDGGVMCPSYRATREELHSTRGRANLLREFIKSRPSDGPALGALHGPQASLQPGPAPTEDDVEAALDLCLSCKACASECAAGVDMSKLKSEFQQIVHDSRGTPLRAWLLGRIGQFGALGSALAPLSNWLLRQRVFKGMLGLAPERTLPAFARQSFDRWWADRRQASAVSPASPPGPSSLSAAEAQNGRVAPSSPDRRVALFVDTFARYNHPHIAIAAVEVLEGLGYEVLVPAWKCCGRPLLSQGQPKAALDLARFNLAQLAPLAQQGIPILGLEPSCISALKDDYTDLVPGEASAAVAQATHSLEAFVGASHATWASLADGARTSDAGDGARSASQASVLLHTHCHQKALGSSGETQAALAQAGYEVHTIESTCCGMAGAFGYEAEHYALSLRIGELGLLPAVRSASGEMRIVAPGTSCREQIQHATGRAALHPVELLFEVLAGRVQPGPDPTVQPDIQPETAQKATQPLSS